MKAAVVATLYMAGSACFFFGTLLNWIWPDD